MDTLDQLIAASAAKSLTKVSSTTPNVANLVASHIRHIAPELAAIHGLWFSGSNVWRWMYAGDPPDPDADIDCFLLDGGSLLSWRFMDKRRRVLDTLGVPAGEANWGAVKTGRDLDKYAQGCKFLFKGRKVDVWEGAATVAATLNDYPTKSHAHCRVAFSFTEGLVVLPNECAK